MVASYIIDVVDLLLRSNGGFSITGVVFRVLLAVSWLLHVTSTKSWIWDTRVTFLLICTLSYFKLLTS
jgi:hypothetical protein